MSGLPIEAIAHHPEADSFDVRSSVDAFKQAFFGHTVLIAMTTIMTLVVVVFYIAVWPPTYKATVIVAADSMDDVQRGEFYSTWNVFRRDSLQDEGQLMLTSDILGEVVDELGLTYDDVYHSFVGYLGHLWVESLPGRMYRAVKKFIFPPAPNPWTPTPAQIDRAKTIFDFKQGVSLSPVPDTNVGAITVLGPTPRVAEYANKIVEVYLLDRKRRYVDEAEQAFQSLHAEVEKARQVLFKQEEQLSNFNDENNLLLEFEKDKVEISQWVSLRGDIVAAEAQLRTAERTLEEVNRQLLLQDPEQTSGRVFSKNSVKDRLASQRIELEMILENTRGRYRPSSPEVRDLEEQVRLVQEKMAAMDDVEESSVTKSGSETYRELLLRKSSLLANIAGAKAGLEIRKAEESQLSSSVARIPQKAKQSRQMGREHHFLEKKYMSLLDKMMIADVSRSTAISAPAAMRIVERAQFPEKPYWPMTKLFLLGALLGGAVTGTLLAMLVDLLYGRVTRYRLSANLSQEDIYAIVSIDKEYLANLYGLPAPVKKNLLSNLSLET